MVIALDKWRFYWIEVDSLNNNRGELAFISLSKDLTPKVITGCYVITLRSVFGQTIEVRHTLSLL